MPLTNYKLGDLIEACDERNSNNELTLRDVRGISIQKVFIETKANMQGVSLTPYKLVKPGEFAYVTVTSRNGEKITLAHNTTDKTFLVSSSYVVFKVSKPELLLPNYLFMFFNRPEFDRLARFNSWGSARETFSWDDFCNTSLFLPPLPIQQKYVDVYVSLVQNAKAFEAGVADLKLVCDGFIEDLRRKMPSQKIGEFIEPYNVKNTEGEISLEQGIDINKQFITPQRKNSNFNNRKIVRTGQIAYCTQLNNENVAIAIRKGPDCIVSGVYDVIEVKDKSKLMTEYLFMWLTRSEFGRFVYWASHGSCYEFLGYENLANYKIPIPPLETQQSIVNIFNAMNSRKKMAEELRQKIKEICPVLIKGSIEEGKEE